MPRNIKIDRIETAETRIAALTAKVEHLREEFLDDKIIDAAEQAKLDQIGEQIGRLKVSVAETRAEVEENKRRWDARDAAHKALLSSLASLGQEAPPAAQRAADEVRQAVDDQRWADALNALSTAEAALVSAGAGGPLAEPIVAAAGGGVGGGAGGAAPPSPASPPAADADASGSAPAAPPPGSPAPGDPVVAAGGGASSGKAPPADLSASADAKLKDADARLKRIDDLITAFGKLVPGAGDPTPADWGTERTRIDGVLAPMRGAAGAVDEGKLDKALKDLETLEQKVRDLSGEKSAWAAAHAAFLDRLAIVERHPEAASAPEIKPKIDAIKTDLAAAVALANGHDFEKAERALGKLPKRCDEVEVMADHFAHHNAIFSDREAMVKTAYFNSPTGRADLDKLQRKMEDRLTKAAADIAADRFEKAVEKLDEILELSQQLEKLDDCEAKYNNIVAVIDPWLASLAGMPADVIRPHRDMLRDLQKQYRDAKYNKTKDYVVSMEKMNTIGFTDGNVGTGLITWSGGNLMDVINTDLNAHQTYQTALAAFDVVYKKLKAHTGRSGIEEFFLGMENDLTQAKAEAAAGRYAGATVLLNRTQPRWVAEEQKADQCKAYKDKRAQVEPVIETERKRALSAAASAVAQADELMTRAASQALAGDFVGALASVQEAERRAGEAKTAGDGQAAMGALKDESALDGIAADFAKALKVFTDMKTHVTAADSAGAFTALIAKADDPAQKAQDEAAKAAPDFGAARGHLDSAIALLESAHEKVLASGPYQTHLAAAKAMHTGTLPPLDLDNCIKDRIDAIGVLITDAEALAAADGYDFAGAEAKISPAMTLAATAQAEAALWPQIKNDRGTITATALSVTGNATVAGLMGTRVTELNDAVTEIDRLVAAKDFKAAADKAAWGAALQGPTASDVTTCTNFAANKLAWYDNKINGIKPPTPGHKFAKDDAAEADAKIGEYTNMLNDANYVLAESMLILAKLAVERGERAIAAYAGYEPLRAAAEVQIAAVVAVRNAGVEEKLKEIEAGYAAAVKEADAGKFRKPQRTMIEIVPECAALLPLATTYAAFETAAKAARAKLAEAEGHAQADAIRPMLERLKVKETNAKKAADGGDHAGAQKMMEEITAAAEEAIKSADNAKIVAQINDAIAGSTGDSGPNFLHIAAAKTMQEHIAEKPNAEVAKADLDEALAKIAVADNDATPPADANAALKAAMDACTRADETISKHTMLGQAADAARAKIAELKTHAQTALIAKDIADLEARVTAILDAAKAGGGYDQASKDLEAVMAGYHAALEAADGHAEYIALRAQPEVEPRLQALESHDHRYAIKANIDTMRAKLAAAEEKAKARAYEAAMKLLKEAKMIGQSALVLADMRDDTPPSVADIKAILEGPGGVDEVDAMIEQLEPDAQRQVLRVAFEARFGCDLQVYATSVAEKAGGAQVADIDPVTGVPLEGPNLKRLYEIMSELPDPAVIDNDSMQFVNIVEQTGGPSYYSGDRKTVVMREGDHDTSPVYRFGLEHQVGKVEPGCEPANDDPIDKFSWNTLHEVGHAVDDQKGFMKGNGDKPAYGGWTMHGLDVMPVADKLATKFSYDKEYISQYMRRNANPPIPEKPAAEACSDEEWESRRIAVRAWIDAANSGNNPWESNTVASRLVIDGKVYHEAYPFQWASYDFKARSQGISGYQFRAPGEWFSELDAAYHAGKLKGSHPAATWLAGLAAPGS